MLGKLLRAVTDQPEHGFLENPSVQATACPFYVGFPLVVVGGGPLRAGGIPPLAPWCVPVIRG